MDFITFSTTLENNETELKLTVADKFGLVISALDEVEGHSEAIEFLQAFLVDRAEKASRRSSGERKPTKTQLENEDIKNSMVELFEDGTTRRSSEVAEEMGISVNKATALLTALVKEGRLENFKEKRISYFKGIA